MTAVARMNSFEGGTAASTITTANTGGTSGDAFDVVSATAPVFSSTAAVGSLAAAFQAASGSQCLVRYAPTALNDPQGVGRVYINVPASPTQVSQYMAFYNGGTLICAVGLNASRIPIVLNAAAATVFTASTALTTNTWYRLEVDFTIGASTSTGVLNFNYYLGNSTTPVTGGSYAGTGLNLGTANYTRFQVGKVSTTTDTSTTLLDAPATASGSTARFGPATTSPAAAFTSTLAGLTGTFNGAASQSPAGGLSYAWNYGDSATGSGITASHTYAAGGTYTVTLTITDSQGATNTATQSVTVSGPAAVVSPIALVTTTGFTGTGTDILTAITDTDPTTFAVSAATPTAAPFRVRLGAHITPAAGTDMTVTVEADATGATSGTVSAILWEGATSRATAAAQNVVVVTAGTAMANTLSFTFPAASIANVTNWNALDVEFDCTAS